MTDIEKLKKAKELLDNDYFEDSRKILLDINIHNISNEKGIVLYNSLLAGCYFNMKEYENAINFAQETLNIDKSSELASLIKYLSYVYLKEFNKAFIEIFDFLKDNPANMYKDTLQELLSDIDSGSIVDEDIISAVNYLAGKNGVIFQR